MQISHATTLPASTAKAPTAVSKTSPVHEKNAKAFSTATADAAGLADSAGAAAKTLNSTAKSAVDSTVSLAHESADGLKTAYNATAKGIGKVASAAAEYTQAGLSGATQIINALV